MYKYACARLLRNYIWAKRIERNFSRNNSHSETENSELGGKNLTRSSNKQHSMLTVFYTSLLLIMVYERAAGVFVYASIYAQGYNRHSGSNLSCGRGLTAIRSHRLLRFGSPARASG